MSGENISTQQVKEIVGDSTRGLTVKQLRDALRKCGLTADAFYCNRAALNACPLPCIALLQHGHYVVLAGCQRDTVSVFYPERGWMNEGIRRFTRSWTGIVIQARVGETPRSKHALARAPRAIPRAFMEILWRQAIGRAGLRLVATLCLAELLTLVVPLLSGRAVDSVITQNTPTSVATLMLSFFLIASVSNGVSFIGKLLSLKVQRLFGVSMSGTIFDKLSGMSPQWFRATEPTAIFNRVRALDDQALYFNDLLTNGVRTTTAVLIGSIALLTVSPLLLLATVVAVSAIIAVEAFYTRKIMVAAARALVSNNARRAYVIDVISQISLIARFGSQWAARCRFRRVTREALMYHTEVARHRNFSTSITEVIRVIEQLIFLCLAAFFAKRESLSLGAFVAVGAYKDYLTRSVLSMFQLAQRYASLEPQRALTRDLLAIKSSARKRAPAIRSGDIEFQNVTFQYDSFSLPIIRNASLSICDGECVAFRGPSGSGKTSVAKLILGMERPCSGIVLIGGHPPEVGMTGFGASFNSDRLISGTIRENITLFRRGVNDKEILTALETVDLLDFSMSLPMRLNTVIGEGRSGLSDGQKQRILLARALVGEYHLLVLDETTSALDVACEARILTALRTKRATLLLFSHRPEVWEYSNRIYSVGNGAIIEDGAISRNGTQ